MIIYRTQNTAIQSVIGWQHGPQPVIGGDESYVYRHQQTVGLNSPDSTNLRFIAWVFHGVDRGDVVEMDTELWHDGIGFPIVLRSPHKEVMSDYDAWKLYKNIYLPRTASVTIKLVCRVNGKQMNEEHPRRDHNNGLSARVEWGGWLYYAP
jgi:hypothetical protein